MKLQELYQEFFHVGKRVSDKVMITRVVTTASVIVTCLVAMSFSAYAFFSHSLTSGVNRIQSAVYELEVTPKEGDSMAVYTLKNADGTHELHEFKLAPSAETTASSGYGKIVVTTDGGADQAFYTPSIWKSGTDVEGEERIHSYTVQIKVPQGKTASVKFYSQWGTCAIAPPANGLIEPQYDGVTISDDDTTTTTTTTTTASTAETGETASTAGSATTTAATTAATETTASAETTTTAASAETTTVATDETATTAVTTVTVTDETEETEV